MKDKLLKKLKCRTIVYSDDLGQKLKIIRRFLVIEINLVPLPGRQTSKELPFYLVYNQFPGNKNKLPLLRVLLPHNTFPIQNIQQFDVISKKLFANNTYIVPGCKKNPQHCCLFIYLITKVKTIIRLFSTFCIAAYQQHAHTHSMTAAKATIVAAIIKYLSAFPACRPAGRLPSL